MSSGVEHWVVEVGQAGLRLDKLLAERPSVGSRKKARTALETGKVSVDGQLVGPEDSGSAVAAGSTIEIAWNRPGTAAWRVAGRQALVRAGVRVVYEDDAIVVCDKPPGLLTDAADRDQSEHEDTLLKRVRAYLGATDAWPAHRIDRYTSGLVAFARTQRAHRALRDQWADRTPRREYLALFTGRMVGNRGTFSDWMAWDSAALLQRSCDPEDPGAVLAEASWSVRERFGDAATLLVVRLVTGRRNQIRLHAQLAGHPLAGETLYRDEREPLPSDRQALHAWKLGFRHPTGGNEVVFEAPLPADLADLLASLRAGRPPGKAR